MGDTNLHKAQHVRCPSTLYWEGVGLHVQEMGVLFRQLLVLEQAVELRQQSDNPMSIHLVGWGTPTAEALGMGRRCWKEKGGHHT